MSTHQLAEAGINRINVDDLVRNPFYAIEVDLQWAEPHDPIVTEESWIRANVRDIETMGPEAYLHRLLWTLKGEQGPVVGDATGLAPVEQSTARISRLETGERDQNEPGDLGSMAQQGFDDGQAWATTYATSEELEDLIDGFVPGEGSAFPCEHSLCRFFSASLAEDVGAVNHDDDGPYWYSFIEGARASKDRLV
jgi:hypothetical protein